MDMVIILLVVSVILFLAVLLVRTLLFRPQKRVEPTANPVTFDRKKAVESLQALVRCKTVSYYHREEEDEAEFQKLLALLPNLYPNVFAQCTLLKSDERSLLLKWEGAFHNAPSVMMAHYDVVPAQEDGWEKPPFGAVLEDGVLWGRGTLDTKVTLNAALSAADRLIAEGFLPQQDVYFAFSGEEEINGLGAAYIVDYFESFGLSEKTGIDLPGEQKSIVYNADTMTETSLASNSFGQTFKVTPIQMITAVATAVNGGQLVQPHLVSKLVDEDGNVVKDLTPDVKRQVISEEVSEKICSILDCTPNEVVRFIK